MKKKILPFGLALCGLAALVASCGVLATLGGSEVDAASGDTYELLTSDADLAEGDTIIITDKNKKVAMGGKNNDTYCSVIGITDGVDYYENSSGLPGEYSGDSFKALDGMNEITLKKSSSSGYWYLLSADGYIGNTTKNKFNFVNEIPTSDSNYSWAISITSSTTITCKASVSGNHHKIQLFNQKNSYRFSAYGSNQTGSLIWKRAGSSLALESLSISGDMTKKDYSTGDAWDPSGLVVTATYTDTSTAVVTDSVTWSYLPEVPGKDIADGVYIEAAYSENGITKTADTLLEGFSFTERMLTGISVQTSPTKTAYSINEALDYTGLEILASYNIGDPVVISDLSLLEFNPAEGTAISKEGKTVVTVTYGAFSTTFEVEAYDYITYDLTKNFSTYASKWSNSYEKRTIRSSELDSNLPSAEISLTQVNKQTATITNMPVFREGSNSSPLATGTFTLKAEGYYIVGFEVIFQQWSDDSVNVKVYSGTTTHVENKSISFDASTSQGSTGLIFISGTTTKAVSWSTLDDGNRDRAGIVGINVCLGETSSIGEITSLEVNSASATKYFEVGDTFDSTGLVVIGHDEEGNQAILDSGWTTNLDGVVFEESHIGTQTVIVSYGDVNASYEIVVYDAPVTQYVVADGDFASSGSSKTDSAGVTWTLYADGATLGFDSYNDRGMSITGSEKAVLRAGILDISSNKNEVIKIAVTVGRTADSSASLSAYIGNKQIGATVASVNQMATTYEFEATAGEVGHASIELVPGNSTHTVYIRDIALYGENDANAISALAAEIEAFDSCNFTAEAKSALVAKYEAVTGEAKTALDAVIIDDYQDGDTGHASVKTYNRCTVAEKMAAIQARTADSSTSPEALSVFGSGSDWMIMGITAGLSLFVIVTSLILIKRSRHA